MSIALGHQLAPSFSRLRQCHSQCCMRAYEMVVGVPPLQMRQEVWRLLCGGPGTASERGYAMANGQIHALDESRVQPSRETQTLQGELKSLLGSQAHHVCDLYQLAPPVAFLHLAVDQTRRYLPSARVVPSTT
jgi:hypothetical protein